MTSARMNRRKFLINVFKSGGALTAMPFLPEGWVKPVVKSGALPVHAQTSGGIGTIIGTVYIWDDDLGDYVGDPDRIVILCNGDGSVELRTTTTGAGGHYSFTEVPVGTYRVFFGKGNYSPLITLTAGETETADFKP